MCKPRRLTALWFFLVCYSVTEIFLFLIIWRVGKFPWPTFEQISITFKINDDVGVANIFINSYVTVFLIIPRQCPEILPQILYLKCASDVEITSSER
jgi:hypothetical protein